MKQLHTRLNKGKMVKLALITLGSIMMTIILAVGIFVHCYINQMNLVSNKGKRAAAIESFSIKDDSSENRVQNSDRIEDEAFSEEEELQGNSNSDTEEVSENEIKALENKLRENLTEEDKILSDKEVTNILLIGSDTRNPNQRGRSDSMILISINKKTKNITAASFLRDIYLSIPGEGSNRLNAAYAFGGVDLLMDTMEQNFKITIDRYVMVDFNVFIDVIDTIGGVEIEIEEEELDSFIKNIKTMNKYLGEDITMDTDQKAGISMLDGKEALAYCRNRSTTNGDFDRTSRQRKVLNAIAAKLKEQDLIELTKLLHLILPQITTNFTEPEIISQLIAAPSYLNFDMQELSIPQNGTYKNVRIRKMAVLEIDFSKNKEALKNKLYGDTK